MNPKETPTNETKRKTRLDDIDLEILRLKLKKPAITMLELTEAVGMNRISIWKRTSAEIFQEALQFHQMSAIKIIEAARQRAATRLTQLIDSEHAPTARMACEAIIADCLPARKLEHSGSVDVHHFDHEAEKENILLRLAKMNGHVKELSQN